MDGGHQTLDDAEFIVDNFGQRSQAVGGARSVGNNLSKEQSMYKTSEAKYKLYGVYLHGWVISLQVNTDDKHGSISRWGRDDDLLGASINVSLGLMKMRSLTYCNTVPTCKAITLSKVVKTPVDSTTYWAPTVPHGMFLGSRSLKTWMWCPLTTNLPPSSFTSPLKRPWVESNLNM